MATTADRRHTVRRASDECILAKNQLEDLIKKVEENHDASIRNESTNVVHPASAYMLDKINVARQ